MGHKNRFFQQQQLDVQQAAGKAGGGGRFLVLLGAVAAVVVLLATGGGGGDGVGGLQRLVVRARRAGAGDGGAAAAAAAPFEEMPEWATGGGPPERAIVDDLAAELGAQLRARGLRTLLVVGRWPSGSSSGKKAGGAAAAAAAASSPLSWQRVEDAAPGLAVEFAPDEAALADVWRGTLAAACAEAAAHGAPLRVRDGALVDGRSQEGRLLRDAGGAALLLWSPRGHGSVSLLDAALAGAARAALGGCLGLTAAFGRHADKPDALVFLGADDRPYRAAFASSAVFRDTFSRIYDQKVWGSGDAGGGGSGAGSNFNYTATIRRELPRLIKQYGVRSMLDSSCGSMHWMPLVLGNVSEADPGFRFAGTDVACSLIERHRKTFAARKAWRFECVDYSAQRLPAGYDLVWSRDSLQHVPLHATWQFLNQVKRSGARFLLVGSYVNGGENVDIKGGDYYEINLLRPPFSLRPPPLEVIDERTPDGKHMLLFDVRALTWDDALLGLV